MAGLSTLETAGGALFVVWLAITIAYQFELAIVFNRNFWGFVPYCRFFAPIPMSTDIGIYYGCGDRPAVPQSELGFRYLVPLRRRRLRAMWNPEQRLQKTITIITQQLMRLKESGARIEQSAPYLRLLVIANSIALAADARYVRLLIVTHRGRASPIRYIVLSSKDHEVARWTS